MKAKLFTAIAMAAVVAACGGDGGSGSNGPSTPADIAGAWNIAGTFSNHTIQVSCDFAGTANINQTGSQMTGDYLAAETCTGPGGSVSDTVGGTWGGGKINGNSISFTDDGGCKYTGTISGNPTNSMTGSMSCVVGLSGTNYTFNGNWNGNR